MDTTKTEANFRYLDAVKDHVVIFDGAMGTSVQGYNLTADDFGGKEYEGCNDYLVITRPDIIQKIHESFLEKTLFSPVPSSFNKFEQTGRKDARTFQEAGLMQP